MYFFEDGKEVSSYLQWSNGSRLKFACGMSEKLNHKKTQTKHQKAFISILTTDSDFFKKLLFEQLPITLSAENK